MHCRSDYKAAELSTFVSQVSCHISGYYLIHVWLSFSPDWSKPSQTALGVSLPPCLLSHSCLISTAVTLPGETSPEFPVWQIHCRRSVQLQHGAHSTTWLVSIPKGQAVIHLFPYFLSLKWVPNLRAAMVIMHTTYGMSISCLLLCVFHILRDDI